MISLLLLSELYGQQAFLVRQTLSSNGASVNLSGGSDQLVVQQSIGQSSIIGKNESTHTLLRQGFIQAPLGATLIVKLARLDISTYPNPFYDLITIDWSEEHLNEVTVILRESSGKTVLKVENSELYSANLTLETNHLSAGSYILQVASENKVFTSKLIKL